MPPRSAAMVLAASSDGGGSWRPSSARCASASGLSPCLECSDRRSPGGSLLTIDWGLYGRDVRGGPRVRRPPRSCEPLVAGHRSACVQVRPTAPGRSRSGVPCRRPRHAVRSTAEGRSWFDPPVPPWGGRPLPTAHRRLSIATGSTLCSPPVTAGPVVRDDWGGYLVGDPVLTSPDQSPTSDELTVVDSWPVPRGERSPNSSS